MARTMKDKDLPKTARHGRRAVRVFLRVAAVILFAWGLHHLVTVMLERTDGGTGWLRLWFLVFFVLAYGLLMAVPFVPGIEIGITLMMIEGPWIAPVIYAATVLGLFLAYSVGEWLPQDRLRAALRDLKLHRAERFVGRVGPLDRDERLALLQDRAPMWTKILVARYRYLLLAILANTPGNGLIGGGGGIFFMAGLSHLFRPSLVALTILIAILPVPLAVWTVGIDPANWFW